MAKIVKSYRPDGSTRAIWNDAWHGGAGRDPDADIRRASRVELIKSGPLKGRYLVDFNEMGEGWAYCLARTFATHAEAVAAEQAWLVEHWVCP